MTDHVVAVVLAAGAGSRFGGAKLLAPVAGRPVLQHVLDALATAELAEVIVVLGDDAPAIEAAIEWRAERRLVNPDPRRGLSSSLGIGVEAVVANPAADAALILLGDQPLVPLQAIQRLLAAPSDPSHPVVVPVYPADRGRNPVLLRRSAFDLANEADGDRGLGPVLEAHPDLVAEIPVTGANPDVDTPADLATIAEAAWGARVRANREQVDRVREVPDGTDFYAPVNSLFRADPTRTDDPVLDRLLGLGRSGDRWLDVGAGAGRYALPLARALDPSGGEVVAVDASPSMLDGLREIAEDHAIENVRAIEARWPPAAGSKAAAIEADVALIAHVGYDIEEIGPFLDALERAARRLCVAVLMEQAPASGADPFWPLVHAQTRVALPALPDFVEILRTRGRRPDVDRVVTERRRFDSRSALEGLARRQLWIDPAGPKEPLLQAALDQLGEEGPDGWTIRGQDTNEIGIVTWAPR
jgi:CTP:molybdopterin cytidylyltransferase MocA/SAM-dependent methyltransferase